MWTAVTPAYPTTKMWSLARTMPMASSRYRILNEGCDGHIEGVSNVEHRDMVICGNVKEVPDDHHACSLLEKISVLGDTYGGDVVGSAISKTLTRSTL